MICPIKGFGELFVTFFGFVVVVVSKKDHFTLLEALGKKVMDSGKCFCDSP
jgi:hypothetical protein